MTNALEHRIAELDREIAAARPEYDRARALVNSPAYQDEIRQALSRIADILNGPLTDRPDLLALIQIGRINEIVDRFHVTLRTIERFEGLKAQRQRLERSE